MCLVCLVGCQRLGHAILHVSQADCFVYEVDFMVVVLLEIGA
jgi:hypothetical protein